MVSLALSIRFTLVSSVTAFSSYNSPHFFMNILLNQKTEYMVDSHESDAFGPHFKKVHFLNIQNKQRKCKTCVTLRIQLVL